MTKSKAEPRCRWCGRRVAVRAGAGRPREFCTQACRQKDYIARLRARDAGLSEAELVITRDELAALHDQLYVLEAAIDDVDRDLSKSSTKQEYVEALAWVLEAARPLVGRSLG